MNFRAETRLLSNVDMAVVAPLPCCSNSTVLRIGGTMVNLLFYKLFDILWASTGLKLVD